MNIVYKQPAITTSAGVQLLQNAENGHALIEKIMEWLDSHRQLAWQWSNAMYLHIYALKGGGVKVECISDTQGWIEGFDLDDIVLSCPVLELVLSDLWTIQLYDEWSA